MNAPSTPTALDYPWGTELPAPGRATQVAEGVYWLRMALPFALDHINLWLLRDQMPDPRDPSQMREGWTVVDCGIDNPVTREAWGQVFEQALQDLPILRVLVTHMHPDHMGLAHWLCAHWQAPLWMNTTEYQSALLACSGASNFGGDKTQAFFAAHGWTSPEDMAQVRDRVGYYSGMVPQVPDAYHRLTDGQSVRIGQRQWRCISGLGHSPEHIALYAEDDGLLVSGDMLLPSISTNVSVYSQEPDSNALQWFLDSIERMAGIPDDCLVLPSHGRPFKGAKLRIEQLQEHHAERLDDLLQACTGTARCAHELLPVLFKRELNLHQTTFAMGEAIAHLNALWHSGQVHRQLDADGIYRFQSSGAPKAD